MDVLTCSITSGAIQHGVPTKVFRTLFLVISPPVAKNALTPKSENIDKQPMHCLYFNMLNRYVKMKMAAVKAF